MLSNVLGEVEGLDTIACAGSRCLRLISWRCCVVVASSLKCLGQERCRWRGTAQVLVLVLGAVLS